MSTFPEDSQVAVSLTRDEWRNVILAMHAGWRESHILGHHNTAAAIIKAEDSIRAQANPFGSDQDVAA